MEQYDVAVVGLGVLGSAAAYQAAQKGKKVIAFEQFEFGHVHGASHDTSRIVRTSNALPEYVKLAQSAYKDWAELEKATGQKLLTITGGLVFVPRDNASPFESLIKTLDITNLPHEILNATEVKTRWPQFDIPDTVDAVYTADTGIAHASKTVAAMQYLARSNGAVLKENTPVDRVIPKKAGGVTIQTPKGEFYAAKVILTTDAWTNKLLAPLGVHIPLSVMQEQVTYFKPTDPAAFQPDRFPVWIWGGDPAFYGFPSYGEPTIKAGRDSSNNFMTPEQRTYVPSPQLFEQLSSFMGSFIPDKERQPLRTVTCQYTITPDRQFIISPLENNKDIIVGLGAAHAFKFAPAFGRALAELAIDGKTKEDISKFGIPKAASSSSKL
ncbi:FAD dependent oxidoreductase [Aspergillus pseudotamarii]|uniref:sarcosine oxidasee (formaldehyde-forming) n=1 Tax=Aspergillus pseudotamarii TaxID=132259 RepID=A0A5N6T6F1_ASPPS|nr:FAD dependent oxidoreductase [Aspergillus pseudotamarii]KAE8141870.1 FAD dependent oxidoreductase [Aspergillus pseudotamarii]